jgi:glyoxylase-like metal-dependent hydrolase (beta-lactamase superfamily II)
MPRADARCTRQARVAGCASGSERERLLSLRLYAFTCGYVTGPLGGFLAGLRGRLRVPVPAFLVVHPRGTVVFDSGLHPETQRDAARWLGDLARVFELEFRPGEELAARLRAQDVDPNRVDFLVNSHLHFDHVGGNAALPNATLVIQRREWEAGRDPELMARNAYDPRSYDLGQKLRLVEGEHDLFGDGRVVCVPTYGHTAGHQSLRVRGDAGEVVLAADSCYLRRTLDELHLPGTLHDEAQALASLHRLRALQSGGARIFYGHDPEFWTSVPQAPAAVLG